MRAQVVTPWAGQAASGFHPMLADHYPLASWIDVTGQPAGNIVPGPNLFTIEIVCDDITLASIQNDANYQVLWSEPA
jgi:hypothetical protein